MRPKKFLIISIGKKLGDNIIDTFLVHHLKRIFPSSEIVILMHESYKDVFINNPDINDIITVSDKKYFIQLFKLLPYLRSQHFDVVIDVFFPLTYKKVLFDYLLRAKIVLSVNSSKFKYITHSLPIDENHEHMLVRLIQVLQFFYPSFKASFKYFLYPEIDVCKEFDDYNKHEKVLFINPMASDTNRTLSEHKINELLHKITDRFPELKIFLSYNDKMFDIFQNVKTFVCADLEHLFSLIKQVDFVLSVDTGIVHVAGAFNKPQIVLYAQPKSEYRPDHVFAPISDKKILLHSQSDVNSIKEDDILNALEELICH